MALPRKIFTMTLLVILMVLFNNHTYGQDFSFRQVDKNIDEIEGKAVITNASQTADLDGEGFNNDLLLIDQGRGVVIVLLNNRQAGTPTISTRIVPFDIFAQPVTATSATTFTDPITGFNNIAITLAASNSAPANFPGKLLIGINDGKGQFDSSKFSALDLSSSPMELNHGDFNNDGFEDLAFIDNLAGSATILLNQGTNNFVAQPARRTNGINPIGAIIGDFNDDDYLDLVVLHRGDRNIAQSASVTMLTGDGRGNLLATDINIPINSRGISIAGGLAALTGRPDPAVKKIIRRNTDFNNDGLPDFAVLSSSDGSDLNQPAVTVFENDLVASGKFIAQSTIKLNSNFNEFRLLLPSDDLLSRVGSANLGSHALAVADFDASGSAALVVNGAFVPVNGPGAGVSFRAAVYLTGDSRGARVSGPLQFGYIKRDTGTKDPTLLDPAEGNDTFIAAIPGVFTTFQNMLPDVLHISLNGNIWIDQNITSTAVDTSYISIPRAGLNAPLGSGRKEIVFAGQSVKIPVVGSNSFENKISFRLFLVDNRQVPSYVTVEDTCNGKANIIINPTDINHGPDDIVIRIGVISACCTGVPCGRFRLDVPDYFTLVVKANRPPQIDAIADQRLNAAESAAIKLNISDPDNDSVTTAVKCDRGNFASIQSGTLVLTPLDGDVGISNCTVTATDQFGLASSTTFKVTIDPRDNPVKISSVQFQKRVLTITGSGFGSSGATVTINGKPVTPALIQQTATTINVSGSRAKLKLKKGANRVDVSVDGASASFTFNL